MRFQEGRKNQPNGRLQTTVLSVLIFVLVCGVILGSISNVAHAAIAFRDVSTGNNAGGATTLVINKPTGAMAGDVMIAVISVRGGTGATISTVPTDWQLINSNNSTTILKSATYYKIATASEGSSYTWGWASTLKASGVISAYSGVDTSSPIMAQGSQPNASGTSMTAPSVTTTASNAWVIAAYSTAIGTTVSSGSSMTLRGQSSSTGGKANTCTTSGLQDAVQASAGASGAKTMTAGAAAVNIGHTIALTPRVAVGQAAYRFFNDSATAGQVGSPLAAQDTSMAAPSAGSPFRLRMLLSVDDLSLAAAKAFKLQYAYTIATCSSASYADVTSTSVIKYYDNSAATDGSSLSTNANDPTKSGYTTVNQTYEEANNFTVATQVPAGQAGMWDFNLTTTSSLAASGAYCFRAVWSDGRVLNSYDKYPTIYISSTSPATDLQQSSSRLFENADSTTPGNPLANLNTGATLSSTGQAFRARVGGNLRLGFTQVSATIFHTCAIASDNQAYCWGRNVDGRVGNGSTTDSSTPVAVNTSGVLAGKTILSITTGERHSCALASDNQAYCWGYNSDGQLGNNSIVASSVPVAVNTSGALSGKTIKSLVAAAYHTCAIASDNQAYCWGDNTYGQIGDNSNTDRLVPTAVNTSGALAGKTVSSITGGGGHTCAVTSDNQGYCWGFNNDGEVGDNTSGVNRLVPTAIYTAGALSGKTVLSIAAGTWYTCAIASDNQAYCWGYNGYGQVGDNTSGTNRLAPTAVNTSGALAGKTVLTITSGDNTTCAIASDYQSYCWGFNGSGQIGDNSKTQSLVPKATYTSGALSGKKIMNMANGNDHTCVITNDNQAYCWGYNGYGGIGDNTTGTDRIVPTAVYTTGALAGKIILSIAAGYTHTCAIASDNLVYCWGDNTYGQIGNNAASTATYFTATAVDTSGVLSGKTIKSISAGYYYTCVIASDDQVYCWGGNSFGQIGDNSSGTDRFVPTAVDTSGVLSGKTVLSITTGGYHTCAIASDNLAYCWGLNGDGQIGDNTSGTNRLVPTAVYTAGALSGKTILGVSAGEYHMCAIASDNQAYCWGRNTNGEIGDNTSGTNRLAPTAVYTAGAFSGKTVLSISAGGVYNTCAIASDNQAYCWGYNNDGEIGDNTTGTNRLVPTAVYTAGALSGKTVSSISVGSYYACAIASDDQAYCWGLNTNGQLGDNSTTQRSAPTAVYTSGALSGKTVSSISLGYDHPCVVASDNQAYCWGYNNKGQIGDSTTVKRLTPSKVLNYYANPAGFTAFPGQMTLTLQYAAKTATTCSAQTGFATVTGSTAIAFNDNPSVSNGAAITTIANDPTPNDGTVAQSYIDSAGSFSNTSQIDFGKIGLWDFSLKDNSTTGETTYCLRLADSSGTALSNYISYIEITTAVYTGGSGPTLDQQLRGGQAVINGTKSPLSF